MEKWLVEKQGRTYCYKIEKIRLALDLLGNPEKRLPTIHVAGTNGKGSTIAFLSQLLQGHGFRVGTFTSPHLETVHDRISINNQPMKDVDFQQLLKEVVEIEKQVIPIYEAFSYFETLLLIMFIYFSRQRLDYALIEVGIGGGEDVTVVVNPLLTLITSIGLDHQDLLGDSLTEIAEQKSGIVKKKVPLLVGPLVDEALAVCRRVCHTHQAPLYQFGKDFRMEGKIFTAVHHETLGPIKLGLRGNHQSENAALALQAACLLAERDGWEIDKEKALKKLEQTKWPGRLELISSDPSIYLDGAHNLPAIQRLIDFIQQEGKEQVTILFSALKQKDYKEMLVFLKESVPQANLILTSFGDGKSIGEEEALGFGIYRSDYKNFIHRWREKAAREEVLFITGSLYFISEVRPFLLMPNKKKK